MTELWPFEIFKIHPLNNQLRRSWALVRPYMHMISFCGPIFLCWSLTVQNRAKIQKPVLKKNIISL